MFLSRFARLAIALLALAVPAAANILTVGPAGSGAQFTQIQAAIDAASNDDVILVKPGTYQKIVVAKPLRILGDGTGTVRIEASREIPVKINGIGAPQELVLSGVQASLLSGPQEQVVLVQDCPGTVVLQDLVLPQTFVTGVRAENCGRVLVLGSRIHAGSVFDDLGAVLSRSSDLWIADSDITGAAFGSDSGRGGTAPGVDLLSSKLHVWRSRIKGGGPAGATMGAWDGSAGIRAMASSVDLFGGPDTAVGGGPGGGPFSSRPGGAGLDLFQDSHARIQDDVPVQGGLDGEGLVRAPAVRVDGTSSFTLDPKVFPTLVASAQQVQLGSTFSLTLTGNPGGYQVLFLSFRTGPTTIYRGVDGFGLLDRPNMRQVASEVLPASGAYTLNVRVPSTLSLIGTTAFFQAAEQLVTSYAIGNPTLVTVRG